MAEGYDFQNPQFNEDEVNKFLSNALGTDGDHYLEVNAEIQRTIEYQNIGMQIDNLTGAEIKLITFYLKII